MPTAARSDLAKHLRRGLLVGVAIALVFVLAGRLVAPTSSMISTVGASAMLLTYGVAAVLLPSRLNRRQPEILSRAVLFGGLAGAVFAGEVILEYVFLPADNTPYGMVEFGIVLTLYFAAAFVVAWRSGSLPNAVLTSVASAFIASLIWIITVLAVFYAFRGSARQAQVLRAEGDYEDFARSGMSDFNAFIMEDFMGAAFFHLLLGLVVAAILGLVGGLAGKAMARLRK